MTDRERDMAKEIIDLRIRLMLSNLGRGGCPWRSFTAPKEVPDIDCNKMDCDGDCMALWKMTIRQEIGKKVVEQFHLKEGI